MCLISAGDYKDINRLSCTFSADQLFHWLLGPKADASAQPWGHGLQAGPETWPVHVVGVPPASRSDPPLLALLGLGAVPRRGYGNMTQIFWDRFCACCLESERLREKPALVKEQIRPIQHAECSQGLALRACGVEWLLLQGFDQHHQCPRSDGLPGRALSRGHRNPTPKSPQPLGTRRRGASKSERERENLLTTTERKESLHEGFSRSVTNNRGPPLLRALVFCSLKRTQKIIVPGPGKALSYTFRVRRAAEQKRQRDREPEP